MRRAARDRWYGRSPPGRSSELGHARAGRVALLLAVLLATGLAGCSEPSTDDPAPAATTSPTPSPLPPLTPVRGERQPGAPSTSSAAVLGMGRVPEADRDALLALAHATADWLDAHLTDLQAGGTGLLRQVATPGLLAATDRGSVAAVTWDLASRQDPVRAARYELRVAQAGVPAWLEAAVTVTRHSGRTVAATLVFVPSRSGPRLVAFGPPAPEAPGMPTPASSP